QQAHRVVVVGHLPVGRIDAIDRGRKAAEMIVRQPHQLERWQVAVGRELVEFALPLLETPEIRELVVIAAEKRIRYVLPRRVAGKELALAERKRVVHRGNESRAGRRQEVAGQIAEAT